MADQVVYTDMAQPQILSGAVKLTSLEVAGNVDVVLVNDVDLRHLDANTVKVTGDFALQGDVWHPHMCCLYHKGERPKANTKTHNKRLPVSLVLRGNKL